MHTLLLRFREQTLLEIRRDALIIKVEGVPNSGDGSAVYLPVLKGLDAFANMKSKNGSYPCTISEAADLIYKHPQCGKRWRDHISMKRYVSDCAVLDLSLCVSVWMTAQSLRPPVCCLCVCVCVCVRVCVCLCVYSIYT